MVTEGPGATYCRRDLPLYLAVLGIAEAATFAQSVVLGWTVYRLANTPFALGMVGIAQFVPMLLLMLPAGDLCDRRSPRRVLSAGLGLQAVCALGFLVLTTIHPADLWPFYALSAVFGVSRALVDPARQALLPLLVPQERLSRALAAGASAAQLAMIAGPALGGIACSFSPGVAFAACCTSFLAALLGAGVLGGRQVTPTGIEAQGRFARLGEGVAFVRSRPILLGAISLDLFALLLGGATALLPAYARDILHVGPTRLGLMQSAPAAGACVIGLVQTHHPPARRVGPQLLGAVAVFGLATLVFAWSTSFGLSLAALFVLGAADMVSMTIRSTLIQLGTPDAMRGRVAAVNMLFVGTSSELGAFESGSAAALFGTVPAVALGGLGTLIVVAIWAKVFPGLWRADRLDGGI